MAESHQSLPGDLPITRRRLGGCHRVTHSRNHTGALIAKIEDLFETLTDCLLNQGSHFIFGLKNRRKPGSQKPDFDNVTSKSLLDSESRAIEFPSRSPQEAWKFTVLLRILELSHEALVTGVAITKRDLYYRDPELFRKQAVIDRFVDDIALTLGADRDALNLVAAAKGLTAGAFTVTTWDNIVSDFRSQTEGMLVPSTMAIADVGLDNVKWILVVEKEATFRTLATTGYWNTSVVGKGILITAKGYPDIQTRQFIRFLSVKQSNVPLFALVDFDPDGLGILSTYKYGSTALAHESANLSVPSIRWLGVRTCDIMRNNSSLQGLLRLTVRDRRIAHKMLERKILEEDGVESEWRREMQVMLMLNIKAEIQKIGNEGKLAKWLDERLQTTTQADSINT